MYKAIEAWRVMEPELFREILQMLLHAGYIGAVGTLNNYAAAIAELMGSYYAAKQEVCLGPNC